ncbi:hypothetical protein SEA_SNEK_32 [Arthrobacter phage Snek]|uniref:DUF7455 domain-containing protein n=1 Tax=Arthrobacter phage Tweety19 TaxID=2768133 RepID=A0A7G9W230_9CAUD|nr:hypothetical protein PQE19_gp32 [Arthrobacter phage Tweety19]QNO12693.1 hypothetical protein SEA_TWEETY19_32 [Arthrobacter phage Tweety19]
MKIPVTTSSEPVDVAVNTASRPPATLTHADRCDACGVASRAYVVAMFPHGAEGLLPLYLCAHHFQKHEAEIRDRAVTIVDERFQLYDGVAAQKRANY